MPMRPSSTSICTPYATISARRKHPADIPSFLCLRNRFSEPLEANTLLEDIVADRAESSA